LRSLEKKRLTPLRGSDGVIKKRALTTLLTWWTNKILGRGEKERDGTLRDVEVAEEEIVDGSSRKGADRTEKGKRLGYKSGKRGK